MKTSDFVAIATRELTEHIGPMAEFVVSDSLHAAKLDGKLELSPLDWQMLMLHFKMTIPSFLDGKTIARNVEQKLLQKSRPPN